MQSAEPYALSDVSRSTPATALLAVGGGCPRNLLSGHYSAGCFNVPLADLYSFCCLSFIPRCMQNGKCLVKFNFSPKDSRVYEAKVPLYLDDNTTQPYYTVEMRGEGLYPRLIFDTKECIMPAVPLGFASKAQFHVISHGYDNLQLKVCTPYLLHCWSVWLLSQSYNPVVVNFLHTQYVVSWLDIFTDSDTYLSDCH